MWPEYALRGRRVDFALCHPPGKPIVFIEVKQVGQGADAERQLFEYAFHEGVPLAILTTAQEWHFFLPAERGDYGERRVYKLDLLERDPEESIARLKRYLDYQAVTSGEAMDAARADYKSIARDREIKRTLPEAWQKLITEGNESLIELVADKVESLCGFRPDPDVVVEYFAKETSIPLRIPTKSKAQAPSPTIISPIEPATVSKASLDGMGFMLFGQNVYARSARDVLVKVFQEFAKRDPTFLDRFATRTRTGGNRPYLARSREALFPKSAHLALDHSYSRELLPGSGWWIDMNLSRQTILRVITMACEVAKIRLGRDLIVNMK